MKILLYLKRKTVIIRDPHNLANTDREGIGIGKVSTQSRLGLANPPITAKSREIRKYQHGRRWETARFSFVRKSK